MSSFGLKIESVRYFKNFNVNTQVRVLSIFKSATSEYLIEMMVAHQYGPYPQAEVSVGIVDPGSRSRRSSESGGIENFQPSGSGLKIPNMGSEGTKAVLKDVEPAESLGDFI